MKNTKWILENRKTNENCFLSFKEKKLDNIVEEIILDRNLSTNDNFNFDPFDLQDMDIAVNRILKAIENKEKIYIYGDYDVDGITSVSLLYLGLTELGANIDYYIPLRDEGYGLNKDAIFYLKENSADLIISVDCGINSISEIDYANSLNIDFIITDHHEITSTLPKAFAVINPKRNENMYEFKYLAGVGTAFMLIYALFQKKNKSSSLDKFLDIVAIGTVADIVPLVSDNRKFVRRGLEQLKETCWIGIKQLIRKIFPDDYNIRKYYSYDIGYIIAPIFNAAGRLEDAKNAVKLFLEEDPLKCLLIIDDLIKNNTERKEIQKEILETSIKKIEENKLYEKNIILVADQKFHHGVIGIVASKILDKYYKPTIIMEIKEEEGIATASCRSVDGINIVDCLNSVSDILISYGGHAGAAGFTIAIENIEVFYKRINEYIENIAPTSLFTKNIKIADILPPYKVNYDFLNQIELLEPFGASNHTPIFAFKNCSYSNLRFTRNSTEHIIFDIIKDGYYFKNCIFFNAGEYYDLIAGTKNIDIAFKLKLENFKDRYIYKLQIEDIKRTNENMDFFDAINKNGKDIIFPIKTVAYTRRNDIDNSIQLKFNDYGVDIVKDRTIVASLDDNIAHLLLFLKNNFNENFSVKLLNKYIKTENMNLHLEINKVKEFSTYAINDKNLFIDIKNFLIGNFSYNSAQKSILASVFKDRMRTVAVIKKGRGIRTIIETIKLYYYEKKLKVSIDNFEENANFYIFTNLDINYKLLLDKIKNLKSDNILIFSENEINIEGFNSIIDNYILPKNLELVSEFDLKNHNNSNLYHSFLTKKEKENVLNLLKNNKKVVATKDILVHL